MDLCFGVLARRSRFCCSLVLILVSEKCITIYFPHFLLMFTSVLSVCSFIFLIQVSYTYLGIPCAQIGHQYLA